MVRETWRHRARMYILTLLDAIPAEEIRKMTDRETLRDATVLHLNSRQLVKIVQDANATSTRR